jgi:hypothetical protein
MNYGQVKLSQMISNPALDRVIEAYGGLALWRKLRSVVLQMDSLGGLLPAAKGRRRTFAQPTLVTVDPPNWRAEFHDFPEPGMRVIFARGAIQVIDRSGAVRLDRPKYRETFRGVKKYLRWSHADAAYFFGYALATYLSVPFILPEYATDVREWKGGIRVAARFPETIDTHSADQAFWFDRDGLLVRQDYRAEIVGWWAAGAHFTSDYRTVAGLPVATRRRVLFRVFRLVTPVPVLTATLHPVEVKVG